MPQSIRSRAVARISFAFLIPLVLGASGARAADGPETEGAGRMPALFKGGLAHYDAGRYPEAIESFSRAYEESHAPVLLFNIAQASRLSGDCAKAVSMYQAFIVEDPASADVSRAQGWIRELGGCGEAKKPVSAPTVSGSSKPPLAVAMVAAQPRAPESSPCRVLCGALAGASGAFAIAAGLAWWRVSQASSDTSALFARGGTWDEDAAAIERGGHRAEIEGTAFLVGAVVSGSLAYLLHLRWR